MMIQSIKLRKVIIVSEELDLLDLSSFIAEGLPVM